jgi:hypothetical protein
MKKISAAIAAVCFVIPLCSCDFSATNPLDAGQSADLTGIVVAGTIGTSGLTDGTGTAALFNYPGGICTDGAYLYISDGTNNNIRRIVISTGVVSTFAGSTSGAGGYTNGTGTVARFSTPSGICTDGTNLYVVDSGNQNIRKIVIATAAVTILAGSTTQSAGSEDGTGTSARFGNPRGICTDNTSLYVVDYGNHLIRRIVIASGVVTTLAGNAVVGTSDGTGAAAAFDQLPGGICVSGTKLFVLDGHTDGATSHYTIRVLDTATLAVSTPNLYNPYSAFYGMDLTMAYDGSQYLYLRNYVVDTSSWYFKNRYIQVAAVASYSITSCCLNGSDIYCADAYNHVIVKVANGTLK